MKNKALLSALMLTLVMILAGTVTHDITLPMMDVIQRGEFNRIQLSGAQTIGEAGQPALPWVGIRLLLPIGTKATDIRVERWGEDKFRLDKNIEPIQQQYPISWSVATELTLPDPSIYKVDDIYPRTPHTGANTQYLAGHSICFSAVCPFDYNPVTGELVYYSRLRVVVETSFDPQSPAMRGLNKEDIHTRNLLMRSVDNPDAVPNYTLPSQGYDYIIIYDSAKYNQWLPLKTLYDTRGYNVLMKTIQDIYSQYTGASNPEKIRNYLTAMYASNTLRYVFLAGDTDVIPCRGLYATSGTYVSANIPADIYYSSLDGNWNEDGDANWGEFGEEDLVPEFAVGRFCYNNDTEIANFLTKLTDYLNTPETGEVKSALYLGEKLNNDPTWGCDYTNELIGGSSANGYTTVGIPADWNSATLCDRNAVWGINQLKPLISEGYNFVNHMGHGNTTSSLGIGIADVTEANFTNDGDGENYSLIYTQACYSGSFDSSDCISEKFMSISTAAVAMISNSRYGWYAPSSTNGASQHFHREYIDACFGEYLAENGDALVDSKIDTIPYTLSSGVMHWVHYELNLMGDPAMKVWTDTPQSFSAQLPDAWITGLDHYLIQTNAPRANIRIKDGFNFLYEGFADANGLVYIHLDRIIAPGTYDLYVNAANIFPWHTRITFQASIGAYLTCIPVVFHDSDGLHHTGEEIPITVTIHNAGLGAQLSAGTLVLTCSSPNIEILSSSHNFAPLAVNDSLVIADVFLIGIQGEFSDLSSIQLFFTASFDDTETESHAWLTLNAPVLRLTAYQTENPTLHILPGDSPTLTLSFANLGSGNAYSPILELDCSSPYAVLSGQQINLPVLDHTAEQTVTEAFSVLISPLAPLNETIVINYSLDAENGPASQGEFRIYVSESGYHFENNLLGFSVLDLNPAFTNQWHRDSYRNYTENGSYAMKFGGEGSEYYDSSSYGALVSPTFALGTNSQLRFKHWMQAENDANPLQAWDGGLVQMSNNGGEWFQITPIGAYPCTIINNPACPFPVDTPVWSGSFDWTEAVFDLSSYSGSATFRWVFGSDGSLNFEGWYVDEISLVSDPPVPPKAPTMLSILQTPEGFQLSWEAVTEDENNQPLVPDRYNIYRAFEPNGEFEFLNFTTQLMYIAPNSATKAFYKVTAVKL
jgi:hypothetical protein